MPQKNQTNSKSLSSGVLVRKSIGSLRVPKKAVNQSLLECVPVDSIDYTDEIEPHLRNNYRFRRLSSEAIHVDKAWLVHNRKLDDAFGNARKRLVKGDGFGRTQNVAVSVRTGFVFTDKWENVETVASEGLKPGNLPTTWLGKPNAGATVSQCVDISLAYLSSSRTKAQKRTKSRREAHDTVDGDQPFFVILVRWLKGRVYIAPSVAPTESRGNDDVSDSRLDPQPGYTCHMTKWTRMDPLDPAKMTLEEAFQISQVYLYEYNDEMELLDTPEHIVPFAVVSCRWKPPHSDSGGGAAGVNDAAIIKTSHHYDANDGAILLTKQRKALRSAITFSSDGLSRALSAAYDSDSPPSWPSVLRRQNLSPSTPSPHRRSLLGTPSPSLLPTPTANLINNQYDSRAINKRDGILPIPTLQPIATQSRPIFERLHSEPDLSHPESRLFRSSFQPDAAVISGRALQLAVGQSERIGVQPCHPSSDGHQRYIVNCCNLVWPIRSEGSEVQLWQLPLEIISYRHPGFSVYEGILQPRFLITGLVSLTKLHYELAGLEEPSPEENLDPRTKAKLAVCPYVSIDRLREWTIPGIEKSENQSKPGRFAGYWGNYFLFTLPDLTTQRCEVAKLCEILRAKQLACVIRMPCNSNAALFIFPDSDFSRSLGIPQLDSLESDSYHGILLLPHSLNMTYGSKCSCKQSPKLANFADPLVLQKTTESQSDLVGVNIIALSSLVAALPDGGKGLLRKTVSLVSDEKNSSEATKQEFYDVSKSQLSPKQEAPIQLPSEDVDASRNVESPSKDFSSALLRSDYVGSKDDDQFFSRSFGSMELTKQEPSPSAEGQVFDVVPRPGPAYYIDLSNDSPEKAPSTLHISPSPRSMSISPEEVINTPPPSENPVQVDGVARFDEPEDTPTRQSSPAKSSDMDLDSSCDSPGSTPKKVRESVFKKSFKLSYDGHTSPLAQTDQDRKRPLEIPKPHVPPAPEKYSPLSFTDTFIKQTNIVRNTYSTPIKSPSIKLVSPVSNKPTTEKPTVVLGDSSAIVPTPSLTLPKSAVIDSGGSGVNVAFGLEGPGCGMRVGQEAPPCKALFDRNSPRCDTDFNTDVRISNPLLRSRSPQFSGESPPPKRPVPDLSTIGHTPVGDLQGTDSVPPIQNLEGCTAILPCPDAFFPPSYAPTSPGNSRLLPYGRSLSTGNSLDPPPSWKDREMVMVPSTANSLLMPLTPAVRLTPDSSTDKPLGFADIDARVLPPAFNDSLGTPTKDEPDRSNLESLNNPTQIQELGCRVPPFGGVSSIPSPLAPKSAILKDFDARSDRQEFGVSLRSPHPLSVLSDSALLPPPIHTDFSKPPPLPGVDIGRLDFRAPPPSHFTVGSLLPSPVEDKVQSPRPVVLPTPGSTSDPQCGDTKREEEEGEIVDDDEDPGEYGAEDSVESIDMDLGDRSFGDADNESLTSYSLSPSPVKQGKRFYLPPRKNTKKYFDYRRAREKEKLLQPYDPSSVDRIRISEKARRTSYRPSEPFLEQNFDEFRYSPSGFQPGYRDVDYRFPAQTQASSFEGSTDTDFSENGDHDYRVPRGSGSLGYSATSTGAQGRYQVYVPKSAEAISMPVKVINHAHVDEQPTLADRSHRNSVESRNLNHDMAFPSPTQSQKPVALLADPTLSPPHFNSSAFSPHHRREASQVVPRLRCSVTVPLMGEPPISTPRFLPPSILPINPVSVAIGRPGLYIQSPPLIGIPGLPPTPMNNPLAALNQAALLPYYASILNCPNPSWGCGRK